MCEFDCMNNFRLETGGSWKSGVILSSVARRWSHSAGPDRVAVGARGGLSDLSQLFSDITDPVITDPVITDPVITDPVIADPDFNDPVITYPVNQSVITELGPTDLPWTGCC